MSKKVWNRNRPTHDPDIEVMALRHKIIIIDIFMEIKENVEGELVCVNKEILMEMFYVRNIITEIKNLTNLF